MRVADPKARAYYMQAAVDGGWDVRELQRQIRMFAYDRVIANQVETPSVTSSELTAAQLLRDPCVAEFLNLKENLRGKEKKVEKKRILSHIEKFILELGKGFTLAGSQYRVPIDSSEKFIDLVFYNYLLRCFVLVDLKTKKLTSRDIGQMDAYRRIFDALKRPEGDNPTIGILLCTEVNEEDVKYSIMSECEQMFAVKLLPYMPTREELIFEIERSRGRIGTKRRGVK